MMWVFFCRFPKDAVPLLMVFHQNPQSTDRGETADLGAILKNLLASAEPDGAILNARVTQRLGIQRTSAVKHQWPCHTLHEGSRR